MDSLSRLKRTASAMGRQLVNCLRWFKPVPPEHVLMLLTQLVMLLRAMIDLRK